MSKKLDSNRKNLRGRQRSARLQVVLPGAGAKALLDDLRAVGHKRGLSLSGYCRKLILEGHGKRRG